MDDVRTIFISVYKSQLQTPNAAGAQYSFDSYFDEELRRLDQTTGGAVTADPARAAEEEKKSVQEEGDTGGPPPPQPAQLLKVQPKAVPISTDSPQGTPVQSPDSSRPTTPLPNHLLTEKGRPGSRGSRRARKAATVSANASSGDEARKPKTPKSSAKKGRVWGADGLADEDDGTNLDYSMVDEGTNGDTRTSPQQVISQESWGTKNKQGKFVLKDLDDEITNILREADEKKAGEQASSSSSSRFGALSGYFRNIVGGKTLTKQDLDKPLKAMEEHLINKNVAREAAVRLCHGIEDEMVGKKTGAFESVDTALQPALENSLKKIMTPRSSLDLLQEIDAVTKPTNTSATPRPYVISIVGVNGVGKSTNLSKICYFLLQNNYRILVVAGDTFRSGAVEQLGVHVRNLKELSEREAVGQVELYSAGYGKDAANVARDAIKHASGSGFDVVLIDTAGRAHTNTQLMSALEKFGDYAKPDKILAVVEALVGNDAVGQAQNFNKAFGKNRGVDGFIVSKVDTVGQQLGTIISLVNATSIPVAFLGVGQHYGDLRQLSVPWAVKLLMS